VSCSQLNTLECCPKYLVFLKQTLNISDIDCFVNTTIYVFLCFFFSISFVLFILSGNLHKCSNFCHSKVTMEGFIQSLVNWLEKQQFQLDFVHNIQNDASKEELPVCFLIH